MTRLDIALVERGLVATRNKAQQAIKNGEVEVNGQTVKKTSFSCNPEVEIHLTATQTLVGRGGHKLMHAIQQFGIDLNGCVTLDIGASTGGFTQIMLEQGASKVYAIDVGHGQLVEQLQNDPRVVVCEGVNARYLDQTVFQGDFATIDVSFISLTLILPALFSCLSDTGQCVALIKPQFEAGKAALNKNGIVTQPSAHQSVLIKVTEHALTTGWGICGLIPSPIHGGDGNIEYLLWLRKNAASSAIVPSIQSVVEKAFRKISE